MRITSLSEAIQAVEYLHRRKLLCDQCGWQLATQHNQFHFRCDACKSPNGRYDPVKPANELERRLCQLVHEWLQDDVVLGASRNAGGHPDVPGDSGGQQPSELHHQHVAEVVPANGQKAGG